MLDGIQRITDQLANDLNRAVFTEDASFRPLGTSAQIGTVDDPRVQALLRRQPTNEHVRYFTECGVTNAREPLRVPASTRYGLLPRAMVPVISGTQVLARIWLIDADPPVDEDEMAQVVRAGHEMRPHLLERLEAVDQHVATGSKLLHKVRYASKKHRETLFQQLHRDFGITDLARTYGCVVKMTQQDHARGVPVENISDRATFRCVLSTFIEQLEAYSVVGYARSYELVSLVATHNAAASVLEPITVAAFRAAESHGFSVDVVGLGGSVDTADGLDSSLAQADFAAKVAARCPSMGSTGCWDYLGEYRLFYGVEWSRAGVAAIDAGVAALIDERRTPLAGTLLAYLEREGDVNATAAALRVHRTTLYYRIERAKGILARDPTGHARFRIHAALRLADLAGLCLPGRRAQRSRKMS